MVSQCQRREDDRTTTISIPIENLFNLCCTTSSHLRRAHRTNPDTSTGGQASKPCMLSVVLEGHLAVNPDRRHTTAAKPSMVRELLNSSTRFPSKFTLSALTSGFIPSTNIICVVLKSAHGLTVRILAAPGLRPVGSCDVSH